MKRVGQIIYVKDEGIEAYEKYHANPLPGEIDWADMKEIYHLD